MSLNGEAALQTLLKAYADGAKDADAFAKAFGRSVDDVDKSFAAFIDQRYAALSHGDGRSADAGGRGRPAGLRARAADAPGNFLSQLALGRALVRAGDVSGAREPLERAAKLAPEASGDDSPRGAARGDGREDRPGARAPLAARAPHLRPHEHRRRATSGDARRRPRRPPTTRTSRFGYLGARSVRRRRPRAARQPPPREGRDRGSVARVPGDGRARTGQSCGGAQRRRGGVVEARPQGGSSSLGVARTPGGADLRACSGHPDRSLRETDRHAFDHRCHSVRCACRARARRGARAALAEAQGARYAMVVQGASGEDQYAVQHRRWVDSLVKVFRDKFKYDASHLLVLTEKPGAGEERATRRSCARRRSRGSSKSMTASDQLVIILIGHGSGQGNDLKFNLMGPDLSVAEWATALTACRAASRWSTRPARAFLSLARSRDLAASSSPRPTRRRSVTTRSSRRVSSRRCRRMPPTWTRTRGFRCSRRSPTPPGS